MNIGHKIIVDAETDAKNHYKTLPDTLAEIEKSNEYHKYLALRLCHQVVAMGKKLKRFESSPRNVRKQAE